MNNKKPISVVRLFEIGYPFMKNKRRGVPSPWSYVSPLDVLFHDGRIFRIISVMDHGKGRYRYNGYFKGDEDRHGSIHIIPEDGRVAYSEYLYDSSIGKPYERKPIVRETISEIAHLYEAAVYE